MVRRSGRLSPTMARKARLRSQAVAILRLEKTQREQAYNHRQVITGGAPGGAAENLARPAAVNLLSASQRLVSSGAFASASRLLSVSGRRISVRLLNLGRPVSDMIPASVTFVSCRSSSISDFDFARAAMPASVTLVSPSFRIASSGIAARGGR